MEKRALGNTGLTVSVMGFGGWGIGGEAYGPVDEEIACQAVSAYLEAGGNFIDTARGYDLSESVIGKVLKGRDGRSDIVLASKTRKNDLRGMRMDLEKSLALLETDYLDLYYLHVPPRDPDKMKQALDCLVKFREEGLIRHTGVSMRGPDVTDDSLSLARRYIREGNIGVIQVVYSVLRQQFRKVFEEAANQGVGVVCRAVLEHGFLTGKYNIQHQFGGYRSKWSRPARRRIFRAVENLAGIAAQSHRKDVRTLAMQFVLAEPYVTSMVVGAKSSRQVLENIEACRSPMLDPAVRDRLIRSYGNVTSRMNTGGGSLYHRLWKRMSGSVFR